MATQVPDLLEPPRLTGDPAYDAQVQTSYAWASYRALKIALDSVASLGTIATQDANNVDISGGTITAPVSGGELIAHKNAASGYVGLSATYQIQFKDNVGTFVSLLTNANTAARTYTFKDADGTVAFLSDISASEVTANKNAASGYVGLSATYQIQFKNNAGTFTNLLTNASTAARTYTFKDADGTMAFTTDITGGAAAASFASLVLSGVRATNAAAPTVLSATTIAPTKEISFVSGTTTIQTITPPALISAGGGQITLIPTGLWVTNTAGNIALASTAAVGKALILTYDVTTAKWYPSY